MTTRRIPALTAAALVAAAALSGPAVASAAAPAPRLVSPATFPVHSTGTGSTLAAAETNAKNFIYSDYYGCTFPFALVGDGQYTDGVWWATYATDCKGYI